MKRLILALALCVSACGGSKSTAPTPTPTPTPTRIISVSPGDIPFGTVNLGDSSTRTFTIANAGNATLTFTGMTASGGTGTAGFAASPTTGTVAPGGTQIVTLRFTPTIAQYYSTVLTVTGDHTSGGPALNISGTGFNTAPLFTRSGTGDNVFDMPTSVTRVRITGRYTANSSNFIVRIAGRLIVNELLGTAWNQVDFAGTYVTSGGVVEITNSSGVAWTFTEVR